MEKSIDSAVSSIVKPAVETGARIGEAAAMDTVRGWGSKQKRSKGEKDPTKTGLYWGTYYATVRRDGSIRNRIE